MMSGTAILSLLLSATFALAPEKAPSPASSEAVNILVLRENGAGSAAAAQTFIDRVMAAVAKVNGWAGASGAYHTQRPKAEAFIASAQPRYGILSLSAFLALRKQHDLDVLGTAQVRGGGGGQYFIVSKTATDLAGCKGQALASNHVGDPKFVEQVVAGGAWKLGDFKLEKTRRPLQTIKMVTRDEATCALVDDAQLADLGNVEGGDALRPVWSSDKLVAMVVVSFPDAPASQAKRFRSNLKKVCSGEGRDACEEAGIDELAPASGREVASLVAAYER